MKIYVLINKYDAYIFLFWDFVIHYFSNFDPNPNKDNNLDAFFVFIIFAYPESPFPKKNESDHYL
jgi:hypothetical protein